MSAEINQWQSQGIAAAKSGHDALARELLALSCLPLWPTWESVRYRLALDRGLKTALDYYNRGRRYRELGMTANAILHWQKAVDLAPDRVAFRIPPGNALYQAGRYAEASDHIRAALKGVPASSLQAEDLRQFLELVQTRLTAHAP